MAMLFGLPGDVIARVHTIFSITAFGSALLLGRTTGVWHDLCENAVSRWPIEWWPSVSATIGDHPGPRAPFHILIALTATPRFLLLLIQWTAHRYPQQPKGPAKTDQRAWGGAGAADVELIVGVLRTCFCGAWIFCTSRDNHDLHDLFMIVYLLLNLPWMLLSTGNATNAKAKRRRLLAAAGFGVSIPPLIWSFYRHSVARIPGAYTTYAFVEWSLVGWDIAFDAAAVLELGHLQIRVVDLSASVDSTGPEEKNNRLVLANACASPVASADVDWTDVADMPLPSPTSALLAFLSDVWLAVCFWTVFTSLGLQLFYWSVWKLALSGSELALLANFTPYALANRRYRSFSTSRAGLVTHRVVMVAAGMALGLGLVVTLVLKYLAYSTNPFWPVVDAKSGGWNITGLVISALALYEYHARPASLFPAQPVKSVEPEHIVAKRLSHTYPNIVALGLGSLIHLIQTFITDAGTAIAWSWSGYPIRGPTLHPFGGVVIAVAAFAVAADLDWTGPMRYFLAVYAFGGLYFSDGMMCYLSGLAVITFLLASLPPYLQAASTLPPSTIGHAMAWLCVLDVASVFTVAYAFVPFGWILRERTDVVLVTAVIMVIAGIESFRRRPSPAIPSRARERIKHIALRTRTFAVCIAGAAVAMSYAKMPDAKSTIEPYCPEHRQFTGGIWTVHFGIDESGRDSQRRMAELVKHMQVDVLGLLETDLHRFVYGNRDLTRYMAEELGYFPIINSTHHLLPSPYGELAPAIHATLDVHGERVDVLVSHNGQEEDPLDRELQTREIARLINAAGEVPTVFLGYLVTHLGDDAPAPYGILFKDGPLIDVEIKDRWRWCEYIGFRGLWRVAYARLEHSDVTDTELQVARFVLPAPGTRAEYESNVDVYWNVAEADIPEPWRFPQEYRGEGLRGHAYRVWEGPLYYSPPVALPEYNWKR
ncbi:Protein cwh43 [Cryptotrichosporon argae]